MFEFLFKYPASVFSKGTLVLAGGWPLWLLAIAIVAAGVGLAFFLRRNTADSTRVKGGRSAAVWLFPTVLASLAFLLLLHPALVGATRLPPAEYVYVVGG